jgi:hypothetical protein
VKRLHFIVIVVIIIIIIVTFHKWSQSSFNVCISNQGTQQ